MSKGKKIGLALSGGGVRGFYHAGLLKGLQSAGIEIDVLAGTSAGAAAAAFYAAGADMDEVVQKFPQNYRGLAFYPGLSLKNRLSPTSYLRQFLKNNLTEESFSDLAKPIFLAAVSVSSGNLVVFSEGNLHDAVVASCALPGLVSGEDIEGNVYLDGGILLNLPASVIRDQCDILIGVNLLPPRHHVNAAKLSKMQLFYRTIEILHQSRSAPELEICDIALSPFRLHQYSTFDFTRKMELYQEGLDAAPDLIANLEKLL